MKLIWGAKILKPPRYEWYSHLNPDTLTFMSCDPYYRMNHAQCNLFNNLKCRRFDFRLKMMQRHLWSNQLLVIFILISSWLCSGIIWQKNSRTKLKMLYAVTKCNDIVVRRLRWSDTLSACRVASKQFSPMCQSPFEYVKTNLDILYYISLKLWAPGIFGHTFFGAIDKPSRKLVGFVDFSMQKCDGSLVPLQLTKINRRQAAIAPRSLQPYLANLLVSTDYRKRGIGQLLLSQCIEEAKNRQQPLHLHVQTSSLPALALYSKNGFQIVTDSALSDDNYGIIFLRKSFLD